MSVNSSSAFKYLHELDKQFSPDYGSAVTKEDRSRQGLHFRVGQYDLLLPMDITTEIANKIDYTPMPISRPWLLGIASQRGQLLTLIDLKNFLFNSEGKNNINRKRIIVTRVDQILLGLVVDQVVGIVRLWEMKNENSHPANWGNSVVELLCGVYRSGDTYFGLCDFKKIVQDRRFTQMQQTLY